ncbi:hypothetical protein [Staphylococcus ratti]|uniref:Uncharacterized protein n=1 Tax=Staphylococcus ratti TaxID=2892440 RepID=A0ABY3PDD2_9STAP|nr:hypothetical protein [Staphylococcus ratti]UEX90347.1 hypothetical protein LN051_01365 [Staphylococcus ratti]
MCELPEITQLIKNNKKLEFLTKDMIQTTEENYLYFINQGLLILKQDSLGGDTIIHKILNDNSFFIGSKNKYMYPKTDVSYFKLNLHHFKISKYFWCSRG